MPDITATLHLRTDADGTITMSSRHAHADCPYQITRTFETMAEVIAWRNDIAALRYDYIDGELVEREGWDIVPEVPEL